MICSPAPEAVLCVKGKRSPSSPSPLCSCTVSCSCMCGDAPGAAKTTIPPSTRERRYKQGIQKGSLCCARAGASDRKPVCVCVSASLLRFLSQLHESKTTAVTATTPLLPTKVDSLTRSRVHIHVCTHYYISTLQLWSGPSRPPTTASHIYQFTRKLD